MCLSPKSGSGPHCWKSYFCHQCALLWDREATHPLRTQAAELVLAAGRVRLWSCDSREGALCHCSVGKAVLACCSASAGQWLTAKPAVRSWGCRRKAISPSLWPELGSVRPILGSGRQIFSNQYKTSFRWWRYTFLDICLQMHTWNKGLTFRFPEFNLRVVLTFWVDRALLIDLVFF